MTKPRCMKLTPIAGASDKHPVATSHICVRRYEHKGKHQCACGHRWRDG